MSSSFKNPASASLDSGTFDFDTLVDRTEAGSSKWLKMHRDCPHVADGIIPYSVADMEFLNAPQITEGLKEFLDGNILGYTKPNEAYKAAVVHWLQKRHNWQIQSKWILNTAGVVPALYHCVRTFTAEGDGVIVMPPVYYPFFTAVTNAKRKLVRNPLINKNGHWEIDFDDLEQKVKDPKNKVLLFCSPQNPTGRVWSRDELVRVGRICIDNNVLIFSDEIHFDIVMPPHKHTVFASISDELAQNSIVCTSASKTFNIAGLLLAYAIIPNDTLRRKFRIEYENIYSEMAQPIMGFKALELAYTRSESWLDALLKKIAENDAALRRIFVQELPQVFITKLEATFLPWMDFSAFKLTDDEIDRRMLSADAFLDGGTMFGPEGSGFQRINIGCPTRYIEQVALRIAAKF
ncbi:MAG: pyridoxal phosphate-dependent aminotransferase [Termitinemataceae bacterium]|nr:MAG: pyridoxal phosphate-dependent aminotransferase [Termitinemataceae bacterium]